jgi:hypothetical protein
MQGIGGVGVGGGVGDGVAVGVAAVVTAAAVGGVVADVVEPHPTSAHTVPRTAKETYSRRIATQGNRNSRFTRGSCVPWKVLVRVEHRREEVADLGHALGDRLDVPAVGTKLWIRQLVPRDRR